MGNAMVKLKPRERARLTAIPTLDTAVTERLPSDLTVQDMPMPPLKRGRAIAFPLCSAQYLFKGMPADALAAMASRFKSRDFKPGKQILAQGDPITGASEIFIVATGSVRLTATGSQPLDLTLSAGSLFGEHGILFNTTRTATVTSQGVQTLTMARDAIKAFLPVMPAARLLVFMRNQTLLHSLSDVQLTKLSQVVERRTHATGELLTVEGAPGHEMFLVRSGKVSVIVREQEVAAIERGGVLGQRALHGKPRTATCRAVTATETIVIPDTVLTALEDPVLERILACDAVVAVQQHSRVFGSFTAEQLADVLRSIEETSWSHGAVILRKDQPMHELFVVRDGLVEGLAVATAGGFQYFGSIVGRPCVGDVTVTSPGATVVKCSRTRWLDIIKERRPTQPLNLQDLVLRSTIGTGESGRVCLAHLKSEPANLVAVKIVAKASRAFLSGQALSESILMQSLSNPFCVRLYSVAEDQAHFYIIMEYVPGGELFQQLMLQDRFSEDTCRFYMACVVNALEYLHLNGIVYRDLKPENLLLDDRGYVKVTDFGFARRIGNNRTFTMCGTPEYQAPEIMTVNMGATTTADFWSLGVLLYEMLTGSSPFLPATTHHDDRTSDPWVIIRNARSGRYPTPRNYERTDVSDLISRLLQVDPAKRIASARDIRGHRWFRGFPWQEVAEGKYSAPSRRKRSMLR